MTRRPLVLACALLGCQPLPEADSPDLAPAPVEDLAQALPPCEGRPRVPPGTAQRSLRSGGVMRTYQLHVPPGYDPAARTPLVLTFHGYTSSAREQLVYTGVVAEADRRGLLVVAPQGTGVDAGWNAGGCCGSADLTKVDDVGFVRDLLAALRGELCVDDRRVYATGFSNGAFFVNRLGCELADQIAAIGPVAGGLLLKDEACRPGRDVPVLHIHDTNDAIVPYQGGGLSGAGPAPKSAAGWAARNGCQGDPAPSYMMGQAACETWSQCGGSEVTLCTTRGAGHTWPGSPNGSKDLTATPYLLDFFSRFQR